MLLILFNFRWQEEVEQHMQKMFQISFTIFIMMYIDTTLEVLFVHLLFLSFSPLTLFKDVNPLNSSLEMWVRSPVEISPQYEGDVSWQTDPTTVPVTFDGNSPYTLFDLLDFYTST